MHYHVRIHVNVRDVTPSEAGVGERRRRGGAAKVHSTLKFGDAQYEPEPTVFVLILGFRLGICLVPDTHSCACFGG